MDSQNGTLYVVATPIGNLSDISERAIDTLKSVDSILAEDTRRTQQLLTHLGIKSSLISLHEYNEKQRLVDVENRLKSGQSLALVSDAGTPVISDPGYLLISHLRSCLLDVVTIPGPCALIAALSISGIPTNKFCFEGFLPAKSSARKQILESLANETRTWVFYESTHRIRACLEDMKMCLSENRRICIARELTKRFETVLLGSVQEVIDVLDNDDNQLKGEFVVIVEGASEEVDALAFSDEQLLKELLPHLSTKTASQIAANLTGRSKKQMYQLALTLKPS